MTSDSLALCAWRKFIDDSGQEGVNCAIFRNEGPHLSSELILEAEELAWRKWSYHRLYTYINPRKIISANPGYCFKIAGWINARNSKGKILLTKSGKIILEKLPDG